MTWVRRSCKLFIKIKKNPLCTGKQTGLQTNNIEKFPATKMSITSPINHPIHRKVQNDPSFGFSPRKINLHWTSRWLKTKYQILNFFLFVVPIQKETRKKSICYGNSFIFIFHLFLRLHHFEPSSKFVGTFSTRFFIIRNLPLDFFKPSVHIRVWCQIKMFSSHSRAA